MMLNDGGEAESVWLTVTFPQGRLLFRHPPTRWHQVMLLFYFSQLFRLSLVLSFPFRLPASDIFLPLLFSHLQSPPLLSDHLGSACSSPTVFFFFNFLEQALNILFLLRWTLSLSSLIFHLQNFFLRDDVTNGRGGMSETGLCLLFFFLGVAGVKERRESLSAAPF